MLQDPGSVVAEVEPVTIPLVLDMAGVTTGLLVFGQAQKERAQGVQAVMVVRAPMEGFLGGRGVPVSWEGMRLMNPLIPA